MPGELLWADIGERLGLSVSELKSIRTAFGDVMGLPAGTRKVPETMLNVVSFIATMRQKGLPDEEIRQKLLEAKIGNSWPDEVLARIQLAATTLAQKAPVEPRFDKENQAASRVESLSQTPFAAGHPQEWSAREMFLDLRREICTHASAEREEIRRLVEQVHRLILEVRDLRYALLLMVSRKDRKKGYRGISRLLSG